MVPTLCVLYRFQIQAATFALFDINRLVLHNCRGESLLHGAHTVHYKFCL